MKSDYTITDCHGGQDHGCEALFGCAGDAYARKAASLIERAIRAMKRARKKA